MSDEEPQTVEVIPEDTLEEEDADKSEIASEFFAMVEEEEKQEKQDEQEAYRKNLEVHEDIAVDYFEDPDSGTTLANPTQTNIDETTGEISQEKKKCCPKFSIRQIPLPLIHPNFHTIALKTGMTFLMYVNVADLFVNLVIYPLNTFCFCFYMIFALTSVLPSFVYEYIEWGIAFVLPIPALVLTCSRYFMCILAGLQNKQRNVPREKTRKRKTTMWVLYIILTVLQNILLIMMTVGFMGSMGLVKIILIGIDWANLYTFWALFFLLFSIITMFIYILVIVLSWAIVGYGIYDLVKMHKEKKKEGDNEVNLEEIIEEDGGNVVFFGNMAFVFN